MKTALFGCGSMARALFLPLAGKMEFHAYTPGYTSAERFVAQAGGRAYRRMQEMPPCDCYVLACKPADLDGLAADLAGRLPREANALSILAGTPLARLREKLKHTRLARLMPNLPNAVGQGVNLLYFAGEVEPGGRKDICRLAGTSGKVYVLSSEEELDALSAVSACGPAYLFELARILQDNLAMAGLDEDSLRELVAQTLYGSSKMLQDSRESALDLRRQVASPAGLTEAALEVLRERDWEDILHQALRAARRRAKELAR